LVFTKLDAKNDLNAKNKVVKYFFSDFLFFLKTPNSSKKNLLGINYQNINPNFYIEIIY